MADYDPLEKDPKARPWVEEIYNDWQGKQENPDYSANFETAWQSMSDKERMAFYSAAVNSRLQREAETEAARAGVYDTGRPRRKVKIKQRVRDPNDKSKFVDIDVDQWQEWDDISGQWVSTPPPAPLPHEILMGAAKARTQQATAEAQLKDIEAIEGLRTQREELLKRELESKIGEIKSKETGKKISTFNKLITEPVTEIVGGGMRAVGKSTKYGKGSMETARESFVATPIQEHGLRPAPKSRFTTPMVTRVPERMPITTSRSGKKIPAGEAIIAPAKAAKEAVIKPTSAGALLQTSVGKMRAAQLMVAPRPTRIGLSNLRVGVDTSGIRRGGALPKLKLKKNLYNEQLRRIRGMLR